MSRIGPFKAAIQDESRYEELPLLLSYPITGMRCNGTDLSTARAQAGIDVDRHQIVITEVIAGASFLTIFADSSRRMLLNAPLTLFSRCRKVELDGAFWRFVALSGQRFLDSHVHEVRIDAPPP